MKKTCLFAAAAALGLGLMTGCSSDLSPEPFDANMRLTSGQVEMTVKEGVTTRADIFRALGTPNVVMLENGKGEIWTYDQIKVRRTRQGYRAGAFFGTGFGFPEVHNSTGDPQTGAGNVTVQASGNLATDTTSIQMATLVIKFDTAEKVASYKMFIAAF